ASDFAFFHAAVGAGAGAAEAGTAVADAVEAGTAADGAGDASAAENADIPAPIAHLTGPIAGFCGAVVEWFDVELVRRVASARPDVQFVFVGGVARVSLTPLEGLRNVHFVGHQSYDDMPR